MSDLKTKYESAVGSDDRENSIRTFTEIREALESGEIRTAQIIDGKWIVNV